MRGPGREIAPRLARCVLRGAVQVRHGFERVERVDVPMLSNANAERRLSLLAYEFLGFLFECPALVQRHRQRFGLKRRL